ncbi:MAG: arginyltransferase [Spirochaetaceae bacterium]|nr:MAG: arginyltransferase [Spirochaetaceae bacterium]
MEPNELMHSIHQDRCPYLPNRRWLASAFAAGRIPAAAYESLINAGWRRSGSLFYRNSCPGCSLCIPIRTHVQQFRPSRSQRRVRRTNSDLLVTVHEPEPDTDLFALWVDYQRRRHGDDLPEDEAWSAFARFLCYSPVPSLVMRYRLQGRLVGAGWIDLLPNGVSSVYFVFDPCHASRSLGVYSALREIEFAAQLDKRWLYLGFFVPGCSAMSYKARYHPYDLLIDGQWRAWRR